jgi:hypothetical protein
VSDEEFKDEILKVAQQFEGSVEVNRHLSYVAVGDFYIQGEPAMDLITEIESLVERMNVTEREAAIFVVGNM